MQVINNNGYEVEHYMRKWFHGYEYFADCVDFRTKTTLYEVKSCNLFNPCCNGNHKRPFAIKLNKQCYTYQNGRFIINISNHKELKIQANSVGCIAKYIFVITIKKQKMWRVFEWNQINQLLKKQMNREQATLTIAKVFMG